MAELKLKVDTGSVLVPVENERGETIGEFYFNPLDSNMAKRYDNVIDFSTLSRLTKAKIRLRKSNVFPKRLKSSLIICSVTMFQRAFSVNAACLHCLQTDFSIMRMS